MGKFLAVEERGSQRLTYECTEIEEPMRYPKLKG